MFTRDNYDKIPLLGTLEEKIAFYKDIPFNMKNYNLTTVWGLGLKIIEELERQNNDKT